MSIKYFLDTSFIIAYAILFDSQHKKSLLYEHIITNNECYINFSVLNECVTVAYIKTKDYKVCNKIYEILIDNFIILDEHKITNYNAKTMSVFNQHRGKLSFTDAGIITTVSENNIDYLISFDKEFTRNSSIEVLTPDKL